MGNSQYTSIVAFFAFLAAIAQATLTRQSAQVNYCATIASIETDCRRSKYKLWLQTYGFGLTSIRFILFWRVSTQGRSMTSLLPLT